MKTIHNQNKAFFCPNNTDSMLISLGGIKPTGYDSVLKGGDCVRGGAVVEAQAERA